MSNTTTNTCAALFAYFLAKGGEAAGESATKQAVESLKKYKYFVISNSVNKMLPIS